MAQRMATLQTLGQLERCCLVLRVGLVLYAWWDELNLDQEKKKMPNLFSALL